MTERFSVVPTRFDTALLIRPVVHEDYRGYFKEIFRRSDYAALGITDEFVQENISYSTRHVLRGMHYDTGMAKLVQVIYGRTFHVIVDLREGSPTYRQWQSFILSHHNHLQVYVPKGFANGFLVLSDEVWVHYRQSAYYDPARAQTLLWNDPAIGIKWPVAQPILSEQDGADFTHLGRER